MPLKWLKSAEVNFIKLKKKLMINLYLFCKIKHPMSKVLVIIRGQTSDFLYTNSKTAEASSIKLHRKVMYNEKVCHA